MRKIREPIVANKFYPGNEDELRMMIVEFLNNVDPPAIEGEIFGLIVPHAGYVFSGEVAAYSYKLIKGNKFDSVILIGDSHYEVFDGVSVWENGEWKTPFGTVFIDELLAKEILNETNRVFVKDSAHIFEHSLEVQLPFLQIVLEEFKIVPLLFGSEDKDWKILGDVLLKISERRKVLIIASSDLSHYPSYDIANKVDMETIKAILSCDPDEFSRKIQELRRKYQDVDTFACAQDAIKTILEIAKNKKLKAKLLNYKNSGDSFFGEKNQVVGYSAIAFYTP